MRIGSWLHVVTIVDVLIAIPAKQGRISSDDSSLLVQCFIKSLVSWFWFCRFLFLLLLFFLANGFHPPSSSGWTSFRIFLSIHGFADW